MNLINLAFYKICNAFFYIVDANKQETFEFVKNIHRNILNHSGSCASFYMFAVERKKNQENNTLFQNFCDKAKIAFHTIEVSQFSSKNITLLNYFNNILLRKICIAEKKKKIVSKTSNPKRLMTVCSDLGANSDYRMVEERSYETEPEGLPRLKFRRLSYNQKLSKK